MKNKSRRSRFPISFFIILALAALTAFIIIGGQGTLSVEYEELFFDNLPAGFDGFRIVELSDMHAREFGENNAELFEAVRENKPDIIVITGDIAHDDNSDEYIKTAFKSLAAIAPSYYVTGNHEWAVSGLVPRIRDIARDTGVIYLSNDYLTLERGGDKLHLVGFEDPNGPRDMDSPEDIMREISDAESGANPFILALYHRNDRLSRYAHAGVDLVLCGHAHGGVMRLPFTDGLVGPGRDLFPSYTNGLYIEDGGAMFVSRGLGASYFLEFRVFNDPHLPVLTLRRTEDTINN